MNINRFMHQNWNLDRPPNGYKKEINALRIFLTLDQKKDKISFQGI